MNSVSVGPTATTRTSMLSGASSARRASLKPASANLLAQYSLLWGQRALAEDRADVDDDRCAAVLKLRKRVADQLDGSEEVRLHDGAQAGWVGVRKAAVGARAGVVDEDVEAAEFFLCGAERAAAGVGISHIADDGFGAATEGGDFGDGFGEAATAAGQ